MIGDMSAPVCRRNDPRCVPSSFGPGNKPGGEDVAAGAVSCVVEPLREPAAVASSALGRRLGPDEDPRPGRADRDGEEDWRRCAEAEPAAAAAASSRGTLTEPGARNGVAGLASASPEAAVGVDKRPPRAEPFSVDVRFGPNTKAEPVMETEPADDAEPVDASPLRCVVALASVPREGPSPVLCARRIALLGGSCRAAPSSLPPAAAGAACLDAGRLDAAAPRAGASAPAAAASWLSPAAAAGACVSQERDCPRPSARRGDTERRWKPSRPWGLPRPAAERLAGAAPAAGALSGRRSMLFTRRRAGVAPVGAVEEGARGCGAEAPWS